MGTGHLVAGRYRLHGQIGRGAMGIVWRGRDELLDRDVAVKEVRIAAPGTADGDTAYQRTLREAKTAARLSHPGVVTVFDVVEEDGSPWIVMELVRARSLDQVVAEDGPLRPAEAAGVGERLLSALACAHSAGVLHRDVKPSNVLITPDGGTVLTDFGIATLEGDPSLTQAGMVVGTPGFTAPERVRGERATPASDLWSLGATLYAAVEGRGPFDRPGGSAVITAGVLNEVAPRAPSAGPLGPVIEALLRSDPGTRPDTGTAARLLSSVAGQGRPDRPQPGGRSGQADAGRSAAAATDLAADATTAAGVSADTQTVPGDVPDLPGSPAFADVHEFPELPAAAELGASRELPAFLDLPQSAGPPGVPPGQDEAWEPDSPGLPPGETGPWSPAGPGFLPAQTGPWSPAGPGFPPAQTGPWSPDSPGFQAGAAAPGGPGRRAADARQQARRRRTLSMAAGIAAVAAAGLIAWTVLPHSVNAVPGPATPSARPSDGGQPSGDGHAAAPGSRPGGPLAGGGSGSGTGGIAASSTQSSAGSIGAIGTGGGPHRAGSGQTGGSGTGSGGQTGGGSTPAPPGYRWLSVPAASTGTTAGFRIAIPDTWQAARQGLAWYLDPPAGNAYLEVNLAPFSYARPVNQARYLQATAIARGEYPGYRLIYLSGTGYRSAPAAAWRFNWRQGSLGHVAVQEVLFGLKTAAGRQDYTLTVASPALGFPVADAVFEQVLRTFKPLT
jgi:serine/threonine protein kinase